MTNVYKTRCTTLSMAPYDCILYNTVHWTKNVATNRGKHERRKSHRIQQIEVHSQYSSSFKLKDNFPRFIVNLARTCIQLLFTHRLHLPYKMSEYYVIVFVRMINLVLLIDHDILTPLCIFYLQLHENTLNVVNILLINNC